MIINNYAHCNNCGYEDTVDKFPVEAVEELQGQIHCPKCGSEDVDM